MIDLPSRQVHLDFHTSEFMPNVGGGFNRKQWQKALKLGNVNSITVFAKCHHAWSYYYTKVGRPHPTLRCNLLAEQVAACHEIGVRAPIYYTVGWSAADAESHPEWVAQRRDGTPIWDNIDRKAKPTDERPRVSWKRLCPSGDYLKLMLEQTEEICQLFDVDGMFYDIVAGPWCFCPNCRKGMKKEGLDWKSDPDAGRYYVLKIQRLMESCNKIIRCYHPEATSFYNGTASLDQAHFHGGSTHMELEDLPTTWGGYDKFPLRARYFANSGKQYLAMSGKFHTMWGEFGGFKHRDAIRFEAAAMIAYGARCSFGDQAHPAGDMDMATYRNIGHGYRYAEKLEPYGLEGQCAANLGLLLSSSPQRNTAISRGCDQGVSNMLLESHLDFRVVDPAAPDFTGLDAVILTGLVRLDKAMADKLARFARRGGGVVLLGESGLNAAGKRFMLDVGAQYVGPARYKLDYLLVDRGPLTDDVVESPFLCYSAAHRVKVTNGETLAKIREPYFDRTYAKYCSHQNTPYQLKDAPHPGAVRKGSIVYLPHLLGEMYNSTGARLHRQFFVNALSLVYHRSTMSVEMPSAARATIIHQPARKRYVAHLLYGPPLQRGRCLVIEDLPKLYDVPVTLTVKQKVKAAYLAPQGRKLAIKKAAGGVQTIVPSFSCHQAVVFEYK